MITFVSFIIALFGGYLLSWSLRRDKKSPSSSYVDLGEGCWLTPEGFVDLTPRLTLEQELHNCNNLFEKKRRDMKYESDCAWAEIEKQNAQYHLMKDNVAKISPMEKLEIWIPKWINYMCEWHLKEKNEHEKEWGYMPFEIFIATEIIPHKWYGTKLVWKPMLGQIEYVI